MNNTPVTLYPTTKVKTLKVKHFTWTCTMYTAARAVLRSQRYPQLRLALILQLYPVNVYDSCTAVCNRNYANRWCMDHGDLPIQWHSGLSFMGELSLMSHSWVSPGSTRHRALSHRGPASTLPAPPALDCAPSSEAEGVNRGKPRRLRSPGAHAPPAHWHPREWQAQPHLKRT